jgi:hypothetical protein
MSLKIPSFTATFSIDVKLIEGEWIEDDNYRSTWQDGYSWLNMSITLKKAADKILEIYKEGISEQRIYSSSNAVELIFRMLQFPTYMLLMGYAIENAIKGISEELNKDNFEDVMTLLKKPLIDGRTKVQVAQHGLTYLIQSKYVSIDFTEPEEKEMEELKEYVVWNGRYPIKMKYDPSFTRGRIDSSYPDEHMILVNAIYDKAAAELNKIYATIDAQQSHPLHSS